MVTFQKPMLCQETKEPTLPNFNDNWVAQDKIDGIRAIHYVENGKLTIQGRGRFITHRYPEFHSLFSGGHNFVIDSEIVAKDNDFNHIQIRDQNNNPFKVQIVSVQYPARIMAFDILELDGKDLTSLPFIERYRILRDTIQDNDWIQVLPIYTDLVGRFNHIKAQEGEGIVIKRIDSTYQFGSRSSNWLKCKFWKETQLTFDRYEVNPAGITVENCDGVRMLVAGQQSAVVKDLIDHKGSVALEVQYLEKTKNGAFRMPTFKGVVNGSL